ncbi:MAG: hypothetical protein ACQESK_01165 [Bacteroidota bacterium]
MESNSPNASEEINLGQFIDKIKSWLKSFVRFFVNLVELAIAYKFIFIAIVLLTGAYGFYVDKNQESNYKSDVVIQTNFGSNEYFYQALDEVENNLSSGSEEVQQEMFGKNYEHVKSISGEPIFDINSINEDNYEMYIDIIDRGGINWYEETFEEGKFQKKHLVEIKTSDLGVIDDVVGNLMQYLSNNSYYKSYRENGISNAQKTLAEIDHSLAGINQTLSGGAKADSVSASHQISVSNTEGLDELVQTKKSLLRDRLEALHIVNQQPQTIELVAMHKNTKIETSILNGHKMLMYPVLVLVGIAFLLFVIKCYRKLKRFAHS